jgi:hypothetical protein
MSRGSIYPNGGRFWNLFFWSSSHELVSLICIPRPREIPSVRTIRLSLGLVFKVTTTCA